MQCACQLARLTAVTQVDNSDEPECRRRPFQPIIVGVIDDCRLRRHVMQAIALKRQLATGFETSCRSTAYYPKPAVLAMSSNPAPTATVPMVRATGSAAGARRSMVMAAVTTAIMRRSMTPMTKRIAVKLAHV
jgi:hypothetical protein